VSHPDPGGPDARETSQPAVDALVLAGRRHGEDPLAASTGAAHRALVEIEGHPMLERVLHALAGSGRVGRVCVSTDVPELVAALPGLTGLPGGPPTLLPALPSPSGSVLRALDQDDLRPPLLLTTADHGLLEPSTVRHFLDAAEQTGADVVAGVVTREVYAARYPAETRTWLRLRGESISGANLFAFRTPAARRAVGFWGRAERFRKRPWQLVRAFGPLSLLLFALRRLDLDGALERASDVIGARVAAVRLPMAEAAIDVDKPADLELVRRVLAARRATEG